jgi:hypothetical protein
MSRLVYTISTRRHIPEYGILHSHSRENLKSYNIKMDLKILGCEDRNLVQDFVQLGFSICGTKISNSAARKPIRCDAKRKIFVSPLNVDM